MLNRTDLTLYATGFELRNRVISANFLSFDLLFIRNRRIGVLGADAGARMAANENLHELFVPVNRNVAKVMDMHVTSCSLS